MRARPLSYRKIEQAAQHVRGYAWPGIGSLGPRARVPSLELFDCLGEVRVRAGRAAFGVDTGVVSVLPRGEGLTRFDPYTNRFVVEISEAVYHALESGDGRAAFTICHELGHLVLHGLLLHRAAHSTNVMANNGVTAVRDCRHPEWQANAFAGAFLMPATLLGELDEADALAIARVMECCGVSAHAAGVRLEVFAKHREQLSRQTKEARVV